MRTRVVSALLLGISTSFGACILGEAEKVDEASGAGGPGGAGGGPNPGSSVSSAGLGGMGGMGGMPPTCTSEAPGSVAWIGVFGEASVPPNAADQRITQLAVVAEGVLVTGQYTETMRALDRPFTPAEDAGNAFVAWVAPDGTFVTEGSDAKIFVYEGATNGYPSPRGVAVDGERVVVGGAFSGQFEAGGVTVSSPVGNRDAFWVDHASGVTAVAYGESTAGPPERDYFNDFVFGPNGEVIVSGFSDTGMELPGGSVAPAPTTFLASLAVDEWVRSYNTGWTASEAIQLAASADGRIFLATSIKPGSYDFGGMQLDVIALSGVLVAELAPTGAILDFAVYEGDQPNGDQAFVRDISVGPNGEVVVVGAFFGDLIFDAGGAELVSASPGQTDGFLVVLDPDELTATHWASFGSASTTGEAIWAASIDTCGYVSFVGTFADSTNIGGTVLDPPLGASPLFVAKAALAPGGMLDVQWVQVIDDDLHVPCAAATMPTERNCYHLVSTEEGVYVAGAYSGGAGFPDGTFTAPMSGEDAFLVKLNP